MTFSILNYNFFYSVIRVLYLHISCPFLSLLQLLPCFVPQPLIFYFQDFHTFKSGQRHHLLMQWCWSEAWLLVERMSFFFKCVHMQVHMCTGLDMHVCAYMYSPEDNLGCHLQERHPIPLRQGLLLARSSPVPGQSWSGSTGTFWSLSP